MKPTIGRVVHYQSYNENGACAYAAIITQVNEDESVELATFGPNSVYFQHNVKQAEVPTESHWNWPVKGE